MNAKELNRFIDQGRSLLQVEEPVEAHSQFGHWLNNVSNWLSLRSPRSGLAEQWKSIGASVLLVGSRYYNDKASWDIFRSVVKQRINWLKKVDTALAGTGQRMQTAASKPTRVHVHGPEGPLREAVLEFLQRLDIPTLTSPAKAPAPGSPGEGLDFSKLAFVVVLFTKPQAGPSTTFSPAASPGPDPMLQGVLELGFFLGRIGAKRICALADPGLSLALDTGKAPFVEADSAGAWRIALARSLKQAGITLDMNRVL